MILKMEWKSESVTATVPKLVGNCSSCPDGGAITTTIRPSFSDTKFFFHLTPFFLDTVGPDKFIRTNVFTWIDFEFCPNLFVATPASTFEQSASSWLHHISGPKKLLL